MSIIGVRSSSTGDNFDYIAYNPNDDLEGSSLGGLNISANTLQAGHVDSGTHTLASGKFSSLTIKIDETTEYNINSSGIKKNDIQIYPEPQSSARVMPIQSAMSRQTQENFTGQHRCISNDIIYDETHKGKIVIATGDFRSLYSTSDRTVDNILISESLPIVSICNDYKDKKVFGVIGGKDGDRIVVNSIGEGAIWVSDANGNLSNGDYITSSTIPGIGIRQHEETLLNSSVAKVTTNVDFSNSSKYNIKYIQFDGTEMSEDEYNLRKQRNENVFRKAFVGCTYHCG